MNDRFQLIGLGQTVEPSGSRDGFIRATYRLLFFALLAIAALAIFSCQLLPKSSFVPLAVADSCIWILCGWFGWRNPIGVTFPLFVTITGLFLGQLAQFDKTSFLMASILTPVAFGGLSLCVLVSKTSFSFLRGFLFVAFFVLLGGGVLFFFFENHWLQLLWVAFGVLVFGCWVLYDTSQLLERIDDDFTPGIAAFELILDIVGLHRWLLELFQSKG